MKRIERKTLPVIRFNPRKRKKPIPYNFRVEKIIKEKTKGKVCLNKKQLLKYYRKRIEIEHSISTIKSLGLEHPEIIGYEAVKTHTFLILIYRLAIGIYKYIENPDSNLREIKIELINRLKLFK